MKLLVNFLGRLFLNLPLLPMSELSFPNLVTHFSYFLNILFQREAKGKRKWNGERERQRIFCVLIQVPTRVGTGTIWIQEAELQLGFPCEWQGSSCLIHLPLLLVHQQEAVMKGRYSNRGWSDPGAILTTTTNAWPFDVFVVPFFFLRCASLKVKSREREGEHTSIC